MRTPLSTLIIIAFLVNTFGPLPAQAQEIYLPKPGVMVHLSPAFNPPILKGLKVHPDNPFRFDFILDTGDVETRHASSLQDESTKLIKYFLASLTVPEKDLWVNLSPYEKDRIVPESFGQTEMGRDLLAQDYLLKQITASLIYPEDQFGKIFWKRVYEEANKRYGTTNIPVNTFNKVWIVPEKAVVYENAQAGTAYVVESKLKVMLEQDYLALEKNNKDLSPPNVSIGGPEHGNNKDVSALGSQIVREIVIPQLTKEVNENKNFAQLRQVYNSLILATWYKKKIKDSILSQVYADKNKVKGVEYMDSVIPAKAGIQNKGDVEEIYQQYLQAFKKGVYNYIKEEQDPTTQQVIPRKYFSGGFDLAMTSMDSEDILEVRDMSRDPAMWSRIKSSGGALMLGVILASALTATNASAQITDRQSPPSSITQTDTAKQPVKPKLNRGDIEHLLKRMSVEYSIEVEAIESIKQNGAGMVDLVLSVLAEHQDPKIRAEAVRVLYKISEAENTRVSLLKALHDSDPWVRVLAVHAMFSLKEHRAIPRLLELLSGDRDPLVRVSAAGALPLISNSVAVVEALLKALRDPERDVRLAAMTMIKLLESSSQLNMYDYFRINKVNEREQKEIRDLLNTVQAEIKFSSLSKPDAAMAATRGKFLKFIGAGALLAHLLMPTVITASHLAIDHQASVSAAVQNTKGTLYYPNGEPMLGEKEPGIAYYPVGNSYRELLDRDDDGLVHAQKIKDSGFKVIRVYLDSVERMRELEYYTKEIYDRYQLKTEVIFSPFFLNMMTNRTNLPTAINEFVQRLGRHPWILIQIGNEDHYYLRGEFLGGNNGIPMTKQEYYAYYNDVAGMLRERLKAVLPGDPESSKPILLGQGILLQGSNWEQNLEETIGRIAGMTNINGVAINAYLNPPEVYGILIKYLNDRLGKPVVLGEFGWSNYNALPGQQRRANIAAWDVLTAGMREGYIAGGIVFAYNNKATNDIDGRYGIKRDLSGTPYYENRLPPVTVNQSANDDESFWTAAQDPKGNQGFFVNYINRNWEKAWRQASEKRQALDKLAPGASLTDEQIKSWHELNFVGAAHYYLGLAALYNQPDPDLEKLGVYYKQLNDWFPLAQMYYAEHAFWSPTGELRKHIQLVAKLSTGDIKEALRRILSLGDQAMTAMVAIQNWERVRARAKISFFVKTFFILGGTVIGANAYKNYSDNVYALLAMGVLYGVTTLRFFLMDDYSIGKSERAGDYVTITRQPKEKDSLGIHVVLNLKGLAGQWENAYTLMAEDLVKVVYELVANWKQEGRLKEVKYITGDSPLLVQVARNGKERFMPRMKILLNKIGALDIKMHERTTADKRQFITWKILYPRLFKNSNRKNSGRFKLDVSTPEARQALLEKLRPVYEALSRVDNNDPEKMAKKRRILFGSGLNDTLASAQARPDAAMTPEGGIDFKPDKVDSAFAVQSKGGEIKFNIDPAMLQQLQNAPGFVPVIINIQPMTDLRMFLGLEQDKTAKERFTSL